MIRFVSIVIVMWGLVIQPLMAAAMPVKMTSDSTHSSMVADVAVAVADVDRSALADAHHDGTSQLMEDASKAPCHEKSPVEAMPERCAKCGDSCANGICASFCTTGIVLAAFQKSAANLGINGSPLIITTAGARSFGLPSRIFHPPKHS